MNDIDRWVVAAYAAISRDPEDFLEMLNEGTREQLYLLLQVLEAPTGPNTDVDLNRIGASIVRRKLGIEVQNFLSQARMRGVP